MLQPGSPTLRVALFTDTFEEANGVATLSRNLAEYARDREIPFLLARSSHETLVERDGSLITLKLKRSLAAFAVDKGLYFDPLLTRHRQFVLQQLTAFKPDLLHITGPGDLGFLGLWVAHTLRVPLVASWHTNLHEYLSKRLSRAFHVLPGGLRHRAACAVEGQTLRGLMRFYRTAHFVMAPNSESVNLLHSKTGRPAFLMAHGVDLKRYSFTQNQNGNHCFCIGYVGRLTTEKNVRLFVDLERELVAAGEQNFKFLIVGEGGQQNWLRKHLKRAELSGVLRGEALAEAYGRMDAFVFPSLTDTFGLVILEAMACGVPVVLSPETGKRIGVTDGISGILSEDFTQSVRRLINDEALRKRMGLAARAFALANSWEPVFEQLFRTYAEGMKTQDNRRSQRRRASTER